MKPIEVKKGRRFGRLRAIQEVMPRGQNRKFECLCDCGETKTILLGALLLGRTISCGCYGRTHLGDYLRTHGQSNTSVWHAWRGMRRRCQDPKNASYPRYGGRGIKVCKRWLKFENFAKDMGPKPFPKATLERKNNNGNYRPSNCRWASFKEQADNRSSGIKIRYKGKTRTATEWSKIAGIAYPTFMGRRYRGWPMHKIMTTPL